MRYVYLPGFSLKNKQAGIDFQASMQDLEFELVEWPHWESGESEDFSVEKEVEKLQKRTEGEGFCLVAKSIGTLVAASYLNLQENIPSKVILMGVPMGICEDNEDVYESALKTFGDRITVIQNVNDPYGSHEQFENFLKRKKLKAELIKTPGEDHNYPYYTLVSEVLV